MAKLMSLSAINWNDDYGDKEVVHIVEERKLSPYSNLDFNLDVFIDISIDWNTRISLYIFVHKFSSSVF